MKCSFLPFALKNRHNTQLIDKPCKVAGTPEISSLKSRRCILKNLIWSILKQPECDFKKKEEKKQLVSFEEKGARAKDKGWSRE